MWDCYLSDVMYLSSDLLSGKSVPLLYAAVNLPMDRNLLGTTVLLGVALGTAWTIYQARRMQESTPLTWANRMLQLSFSCAMSFALFLKISPSISLSIPPLYVTSLLYVPDQSSTQFVLFILTAITFLLSMLYEVEQVKPVPHPIYTAQRELMSYSAPTYSAQRELMSNSAPRKLMALPNPDGRDYLAHYTEEHNSVPHNLLYSIVVLLLSFYASVQHGSLDPRKNLSVEFIVNPLYSLWPAVSSALLRAYAVMRVAWVHTNSLHLMAEGKERGAVGFYLSLLLFSVVWNATLLTEQVLTYWPGDLFERRMRWTALVLSLSAAFLWEDAWLGYGAAAGCAGVSLAVGII